MGASCRRIAWDLEVSAFKNRVLGLLVVEESEIAFARIKIDFVVKNTRWGIAPKYLHTNLGQFETQIQFVVRNTHAGIDLKYLLSVF